VREDSLPTALIAGALGVVGRALVEHLEDDPDWRVIGLSRRAPDFGTSATFLSVDLLDAADTKAKLGGLADVTHVFFTPYAPRATFAEEVAPNLAMLTNLVGTVEAAAPGLAHIQLMQGAKWYGVQFGAPYKTPAKEDDPRHMPPNFYYDQQDWLVERQKGKAWSWSALRPHGVWGFSVGSEMNMLTAIAVYAAISKELGLPLRWPGDPRTLDVVYQITDVALLAKAMVWAATDPRAANQPFNMTNGDYTRWSWLWPRIAAFFDMETAPGPHVSLAAVMADKKALWDDIVEKHQLRRYRMDELTTWRFADYAFRNANDQMSSLTKARQAGWTETWDTEETIVQQLDRMRRDRIIP
jgi:nucleoside-diphosphate-sugar epimerase